MIAANVRTGRRELPRCGGPQVPRRSSDSSEASQLTARNPGHTTAPNETLGDSRQARQTSGPSNPLSWSDGEVRGEREVSETVASPRRHRPSGSSDSRRSSSELATAHNIEAQRVTSPAHSGAYALVGQRLRGNQIELIRAPALRVAGYAP